jgi:hypothetical protein
VYDTQNNPPNWGDDRIDQANLPLNQAYTYPANPGQGATVDCHGHRTHVSGTAVGPATGWPSGPAWWPYAC